MRKRLANALVDLLLGAMVWFIGEEDGRSGVHVPAGDGKTRAGGPHA